MPPNTTAVLFRLLSLALLFCLPERTAAQERGYYRQPTEVLPHRYRDVRQLDISYLNVDQRLPSSYVPALLTDKNGFLWVGTDGGGLIRYDGTYFQTFSAREGLGSNYVGALLEDTRGRLWIGTLTGGLSYYDGNEIHSLSLPEEEESPYIYALTQTQNKSIWIGTSDGIFVYAQDSLSEIQGSDTLGAVTAMQEEKKAKRLWAATEAGLYSMQEERLTRHELPDTVAVNAILEDQNGRMWFGTTAGLLYLENDSIVRSEVTKNLRVTSLFLDAENRLWIGGLGTLTCLTGEGKLQWQITEDHGLGGNVIYSITQDKSGTFWLGTDGDGLLRYREHSFEIFTQRSGLSNNIVWSASMDTDGTLFFGTDALTVDQYTDETGFRPVFPDLPVGNAPVSEILPAGGGARWIATQGGGIIFQDSLGNYRVFGEEDGVNPMVLNITQAKDGSFLFATDGGVVRMRDGEVDVLDREDGLPANIVWSVLEAPDGTLWIATESAGLVRYQNGTFTTFGTADGLPGNQAYHLLYDRYDQLWVGTSNGLSLYDGERFRSVTQEEDGLLHNIILSFQEDSLGNVWIGTEGGLHYLKRLPEGSTLPESQRFFGRYQNNYFEKQDGLKSLDAIDNAVQLDQQNRIWWGMGNALTRLDLNTFRLAAEPPEKPHLLFLEVQQTYIDFLRLKKDAEYRKSFPFGKPLAESYTRSAEGFNYPEALELPHDLNHLTFHFAALDWAAPHKLRYSYRLKGLEKDWTLPAAEHSVDYRSLPHGSYTFELRALGASGEWSPTMRYAFKIRPPLWHTPLAYVLYVLLAGGLVFGLVRARTEQLKRREAELKQVVALRTTELSQANAELSQTNEEIKTVNDSLQQTLEVVRQQHDKIQDSINYAQRIQAAALPTRSQLKALLPEHFILFRPRDVVSGDFYWVADLRERSRKVLIATVDCTGHGVPGAFMSLIASSLLNQLVNEKGLEDPADVLEQLHQAVQEVLRQKETRNHDGMDMSLLVWHTQKQELEFAGARNGVLLIPQGKKPQWIRGDRMGIGGVWEDERPRFVTHRLPLTALTTCYLFSDGYQDQFGGPKNRKFMSKRFRRLLVELHEQPLSQQREALLERLKSWMKERSQVDDILVMGIRFDPDGAKM